MAESSAVAWLLESAEPGIRYQARRDLLGDETPPDPASILNGPMVRALLAGQEADGGFGRNPYQKWTGVHWRLVSLVELGVPPGDPRLLAAGDRVLRWLTGPAHRRSIRAVNGLTRVCASMEGNALAACSRIGLADDPRTELLARSLVEWQWPDGGWNCDVNASGRRSSFHESHAPAWGLYEYWRATGAEWARPAFERTAELFLSHRVFRTSTGDDVINRRWLAPRYPPYWHYDILQGLVILARLGHAGDPRCADALDILEQRRRPDCRWQPGGSWWRAPGSASGPPEVVDWGRSGPNAMMTLNALRVLKAAGRG